MAVFRHTVNVDTGASPANLRELEERSERLERSLRSVESRAGRVGTASTKLAGALGRVSPALGDSAMVVNDFADGLEVASMAGPRLLAVPGVRIWSNSFQRSEVCNKVRAIILPP